MRPLPPLSPLPPPLLTNDLSHDASHWLHAVAAALAAAWRFLVASLSPSSPYFGAWCAALLGATCLAKALLNAQYNWQLSRINARLRAGLMCVIYKKVLLAPTGAVVRPRRASAASPANGSGSARRGGGRSSSAGGAGSSAKGGGSVSASAPAADAQTLMSVDAGRLVNLALSFHELWSLPLQILLALYLLYTQVGPAFLAGLAVSLALIPLNRLLAQRIQAASGRMMAAKDARMALMSQLLGGMRAVRMMAWEGVLSQRLDAARADELLGLATRKYLDALCVFFWAATSLLFSLLTFSLVVLGGNVLTPQAAFTSLALFNVLIAPLNAFPW